jgi:hypothetical protein
MPALYYDTLTSAAAAAAQVATSAGFEINPDSWFARVSTGPRKPDVGVTNSYVVELTKDGRPSRRCLCFQVYGMPSGRYELNVYLS